MPITIERLGVNRAKAVQIANKLRLHEHVQGVLLFGSLARSGWGNDIDLIVITDHERASDFITLVGEMLFNDPCCDDIYSQKSSRLSAAEEALGGDFSLLLSQARALASPADIDIFVFPPDWKDHLQSLQSGLPNHDPQFMENIAREAIEI